MRRRLSWSTASSATARRNKQDTASAHGEPLGEDEIADQESVRLADENSSFLVPEEARITCAAGICSRGKVARDYDGRQQYFASL
jgi:transketolase